MKAVESGVSISAAAQRVWDRQREAADLPVAGSARWETLAQAARPDDEPWFRAKDHGAICQSVIGAAAIKVRDLIAQAQAQSLDLPALIAENRKVSAEWNKARQEAQEIPRLVREAMSGESDDE